MSDPSPRSAATGLKRRDPGKKIEAKSSSICAWTILDSDLSQTFPVVCLVRDSQFHDAMMGWVYFLSKQWHWCHAIFDSTLHLFPTKWHQYRGTLPTKIANHPHKVHRQKPESLHPRICVHELEPLLTCKTSNCICWSPHFVSNVALDVTQVHFENTRRIRLAPLHARYARHTKGQLQDTRNLIIYHGNFYVNFQANHYCSEIHNPSPCQSLPVCGLLGGEHMASCLVRVSRCGPVLPVLPVPDVASPGSLTWCDQMKDPHQNAVESHG